MVIEEVENNNKIFDWKRLLIMVMLVILTSAIMFGIPYFFFNNIYKESQEANLNQIAKLEKSINKLNKQYTNSCGPSVPVGTEKNSGTISGDITFPSEAIPSNIKVTAVSSSDTSKLFESLVSFSGNSASYSVVVPAGNYYIYATTASQGNKKAYYNKFITCGMSVDCKDTSKILINVLPGKSVTNITVGDFWNIDN